MPESHKGEKKTKERQRQRGIEGKKNPRREAERRKRGITAKTTSAAKVSTPKVSLDKGAASPTTREKGQDGW